MQSKRIKKIKENYSNQRARFGKYKGKLVSWIVENDISYALWLANKSNSNTKTKLAAQSLIAIKNNGSKNSHKR